MLSKLGQDLKKIDKKEYLKNSKIWTEVHCMQWGYFRRESLNFRIKSIEENGQIEVIAERKTPIARYLGNGQRNVIAKQ